MFSEDLWDEWSAKENANYKITPEGKRLFLKKGYLHFDYRFWFPDKAAELKAILGDELKYYNSQVKRKEYWPFSPFLKILIKTPRYRYQEADNLHELETKIRPICFASHLDSLIFGFYSHCLTKVYEQYIASFQECILAYRSDLGKSNIQFAHEVFEKIRTRGTCTAIALDIKGYFDNIDHAILKEKWSKVIGTELPEDQYRLFKVLTKYSYVSKNSLLKKYKGAQKRNEKEPARLLDFPIPGKKDFEKYNTLRSDGLVVKNDKKGVPQGSAMSSLLSNIYLVDYDNEIYGKSLREGFIYRRYCDDILIICSTEQADALKNYAIDKIKNEYFLTIQDKKVETIDFRKNSKGVIRGFKRNPTNKSIPAKTNATNEKTFYKPLQYLGFEFDGARILIRSSSLSRYFRKMRSRIVKTVAMAYGSAGNSDKIFKKKIFEKYSHLGNRNFITYAFNASEKRYRSGAGNWVDGMNSIAIKRQLSRHFALIKRTLTVKNDQRVKFKAASNKQRAKKNVS